MAMPATTPETITGVVEAANERGIRVGGEWRNVSRFHPVELPDRGARVRLELDAKGFIRSLQVLDQAPSASSSNRDRAIARMSALRSAAIFCGHRSTTHEDVKSSDVLKIAEVWLEWLEKGEDDAR